jgi:hypothetical protein
MGHTIIGRISLTYAEMGDDIRYCANKDCEFKRNCARYTSSTPNLTSISMKIYPGGKDCPLFIQGLMKYYWTL